MIKEIKNFCISISDASKGGDNNLPLVDIKEIKGFDTDKYFKHSRASIDIILFTNKCKYFIEFKSGKYSNIEIPNLKDKITFTMLQYFGDGDETIFNSKNNNSFYLVVRGRDELQWGMNISAMQSYSKNSLKVNLENINKEIKKFEGFCYKKVEILTAGRFLERINLIKDKEVFTLNCD